MFGDSPGKTIHSPACSTNAECTTFLLHAPQRPQSVWSSGSVVRAARSFG